MQRSRLLIFILTLIFVIGVGWIISLFARGYRFDAKNLGFRPSGLLVVTSEPDGAQILVNGELESATDATVSLPPNTYDVELRKEGFLPWRKRLTIKKEEVTQADVVLFPVAPSLSPLTFSGAQKPILSPDRTKIAYAVPASKDNGEKKQGLWVLDLGDLPMGFSRDARQVTDSDLAESSWQWSPDSREILLNSPRGAFLLNSNTLTLQKDLINIQGDRLEQVLENWQEEEQKKLQSKLSRLPKEMQDILERKSEDISFSSDGDKVLYTATGSSSIPTNLISPIPGSSTQQQEREIRSGRAYVYDIKEDRNFLVYNIGIDGEKVISWFPTSDHVVVAEPDKIIISDYDGTNAQIVWSGPYQAPYAIPFPNKTQLLILTSLSAGNGSLENLYALSLR